LDGLVFHGFLFSLDETVEEERLLNFHCLHYSVLADWPFSESFMIHLSDVLLLMNGELLLVRWGTHMTIFIF
jgi:hypothetical protein